MIQDMIMQTYERFKDAVRAGRAEAARLNTPNGRTLIPNWTDYADGRILSGKTAFDYGFVDELGNFDDAFRQAKELAHVSEANLVAYQLPFQFGRFLRMFGKVELPALKVDLGLDLPRVLPGRLYFLAPSMMP